MPRNQFRLRTETAARYAAENHAARVANAPRRTAMIQAEIDEAIRDGEPQEFIDFLRSRLAANAVA